MNERWNPNLHAQESLLRAHVPPGAQRGIDVGCGEGETARRLRRFVPSVVGVDRHEPSIEEARSYGDDITSVLDDLTSVELPAQSFDVVTAVAVLHHLDQRRGLRGADVARRTRWRAARRQPRQAGAARLPDGAPRRDPVRRYKWTGNEWGTPSPVVWPPPLTYAQTRDVSLEVLPDAEYRRMPYFRHGLAWRRPPT